MTSDLAATAASLKDTASKVDTVAGQVVAYAGQAQGWIEAKKTELDKDLNGKVSLEELLQYLAGLTGLGGAAAWVLKRKVSATREGLRAEIANVKTKGGTKPA